MEQETLEKRCVEVERRVQELARNRARDYFGLLPWLFAVVCFSLFGPFLSSKHIWEKDRQDEPEKQRLQDIQADISNLKGRLSEMQEELSRLGDEIDKGKEAIPAPREPVPKRSDF